MRHALQGHLGEQVEVTSDHNSRLLAQQFFEMGPALLPAPSGLVMAVD